jgi:endonuclease/exonuclease/phosphatase family metal-dependent hydrolase
MPSTLSPRITAVLLAVMAAGSVCLSLSAQAPARPASEPIDVMTFNIRLGTANDGEDHWTRRRDMVFDLLRTQNADLVGLQEAFRFQIEEILAAVPGYGVVGVGRDDGRAGGETSAILFKTSRFHVAESGTFWFSDTPDTPGTRTWGNRYNRVSSWARFVDRDGSAFWHYNLHLDHESQPSREKSVELLLTRVRARSFTSEPVVVTGDFNVGEDNPALHALVGGPGAPAGTLRAFVDTFRVLHPDVTEVGTFTAFKFGETKGAKIDYVLVQPGTQVLAAGILRTSRGGRYPSDHFPVTARIAWVKP